MAETTKYLDDMRSLEVLDSLTKNLDFSIPDIDFNADVFNIPSELLALLNETPDKVSKEAITAIDEKKYKDSNCHEISGTGTFDLFMSAFQTHLEREFKEKRISGADYATAYTTLLSQAMNFAIQFELQKEKSRWEGVLAQLQAINGAVAVYKAKTELAIAQGQALTTKAQYAGAVAQLGILDAQYGNTLAQHDNILAQNDNIRAQTDKTREDINLTVKQEAMVDQQTTSFKRRDEYNAVKLQADAFTIQKSTDEGTVAPTVFQSAAINTNITKHIKNVGL